MATAKSPQLKPVERLMFTAKEAGVPAEQLRNFLSRNYVPQPKQLLFHAACRLADAPGGPSEIGFGGARGPGKSHASFAQVALDDCQRVPGLKFLFLRKVGKAARESFEDLRLKVLGNTPHEYIRGIIRFPNGSRIIFGHFRTESDIDNYLGIEYDGVVIEESTQLTAAKKKQIKTCVRTSKTNWRPRMYHTTNPGGVGHLWFKQAFIEPFRKNEETITRFIPATYRDNAFLNPDYVTTLNELTGWLRAAWRDNDWDIAAGQYFSTWRHDAIVRPAFELPKHWPVWCAMDYGFTHPTAVYLFAENDGKIYVVDEWRQAKYLPSQHAPEIFGMLKRNGVNIAQLGGFFAGADVFAKKGDAEGRTIADQYDGEGITLTPAVMDRVNGWGEILKLLGDPAGEKPIPPRVEISDRCKYLIECIPALQHNPNRPEDVLKWDVDDEGNGGDDPADAFRYGVATWLDAAAGAAVGGQRSSFTVR